MTASAEPQAKPALEYDPKNMLFRNLGHSGLRVPIFSLGFWLTVGSTVGGDIAKDIVKTAFEAGINFFDTAEGYGDGNSERELGRVFKELGYRRSDLIISTKIFFGVGRKGPNDKGLSRKHLIEGLQQSLERLQMDYVDIVFAHRPDPNVPMVEVVRAFDWLINSGKAFYWGTSQWSALEIEEAFHIADKHNLIPPIADQCVYSALERGRIESEYPPIFKRYNYGTTIFSPLAGGFLTGKYNNGIPPNSRLVTSATDAYISTVVQSQGTPVWEEKIRKVKALEDLAKEELGCTVAEFSLLWAVKHSNVTSVILGASTPQQVLDNLKAVELLPKFTDEIYEKANKLLDSFNQA